MTRTLFLAHHLYMSKPYYEVCYESQWEPYYVLPRTAPGYDERFANQGGDKQAHALLLNVAGYRFWTSRHEFITHLAHESEPKWFEERKGEFTYFEGFVPEMERVVGRSARWAKCPAVGIGWQEERRGIVGAGWGI